MEKNVKRSIYCGFQLWHQGSAAWEKEEGPFFLSGTRTQHSAAQHPGVPRQPLNATEITHSRGKCGKQANHTGKTKEGFVFLDKDLLGKKYDKKTIKSPLKRKQNEKKESYLID